MSEFTPKNPNYVETVREAFDQQGYMKLLGIEMADLKPGFCELHLPFRDALDQHHGYFHGGAIASLADVAGGFAGYSLLPAGKAMLTVEYKINIVSPGMGAFLKGVGQVVKAGRTLSIVEIKIYGVQDGKETLCATALQTLMAVDQVLN